MIIFNDILHNIVLELPSVIAFTPLKVITIYHSRSLMLPWEHLIAIRQSHKSLWSHRWTSSCACSAQKFVSECKLHLFWVNGDPGYQDLKVQGPILTALWEPFTTLNLDSS